MGVSARGAGMKPGGLVRHGRWLAAAVSVLCLTVLGSLWYQAVSAARDASGIGTPLPRQRDLEAYLGGLAPAEAGAPRIPTGVFVQSVEFTNASNVVVSGYVWQKYDGSVPAGVARGFVLPEALEEAHEAEEVERFVENGVEVVRWYFHATLRQHFDYGRYPFDRQDVWLRLWHPDRGRGVLLVPDFASYPEMEAASLPGVDEELVFDGWSPEFAGFSYAVNRYSTTFGHPAEAVRDGAPELYFTVGLRRDVVGPLVGDVVPMGVVFVLLYVCLSLTTLDGERRQRTDFTTSSVLSFCAALLFVALLYHNRLRGALPANQLAYLENGWFIAYVAILLVAVNAALLGSRGSGGLLAFGDNALPKLLYWPLVSGSLLAATVVGFA